MKHVSLLLSHGIVHIARYAMLTQRNHNDRTSADTGKSAINFVCWMPVSALRTIAGKSPILSITITVITVIRSKT